MEKYKAFRSRMELKYGDPTSPENPTNTKTAITADHRIMSSRTRSEIIRYELEREENEVVSLKEVEKRYCIISDIDSFYKRLVWYRPNDHPTLGEYIKYKDKTYLTTLTKEVEYFPHAEIMFCNFDFPVKGRVEKVIVGMNNLNRPIEEYITYPDYTIPCSARTTVYSTIDNSQMPLPVGALYVYIAYHKDINIPYNYKFDFRNGTYKVTSINESFLLEDENKELYGYIELRCQREQKEGEGSAK